MKTKNGNPNYRIAVCILWVAIACPLMAYALKSGEHASQRLAGRVCRELFSRPVDVEVVGEQVGEAFNRFVCLRPFGFQVEMRALFGAKCH